MATKNNRWKQVQNKFKELSPQKKTWYILVFVLAIVSFIWAITATALLDAVRESYYELSKNIIADLNNGTNNFLPLDQLQNFQGWINKGPEALSWYFASEDKVGVIYYYNAVIFAIIALPTCIFSIVTLLVNFFPKKSKEEKLLLLEKKQKKDKARKSKKAKIAKQKAGK